MRFSTVVCRLSQLRNCCKKRMHAQYSQTWLCSICIVQIHRHIQNTQSLHKKSPTHVPVSPTAIYFFPCCLSEVLSVVESKFHLFFCIVPSLQICSQGFREQNLQRQIRITSIFHDFSILICNRIEIQQNLDVCKISSGIGEAYNATYH